MNISELSALPQEGLTWAPRFWNNWGLCTTGLQFYWDASPPYIFPSKYFFKKQLVLDTYSKNSLWWALFIVKLQSEHCRFVTLLKELHHRNFWEIFKLCNQLFFATFSFIYMYTFILKNKKKVFYKSCLKIINRLFIPSKITMIIKNNKN